MWSKDVKNEIRDVLSAEWGDRFLIDDSESSAGFTFSRGMLDARGNYTVQRVFFPYKEACSNPVRVAQDLRRILAEDAHHTEWVAAPAPVQSITQEVWQKQVTRLAVAMQDEGIEWENADSAFVLSDMFDAVIAAIRGEPER